MAFDSVTSFCLCLLLCCHSCGFFHSLLWFAVSTFHNKFSQLVKVKQRPSISNRAILFWMVSGTESVCLSWLPALCWRIYWQDSSHFLCFVMGGQILLRYSQKYLTILTTDKIVVALKESTSSSSCYIKRHHYFDVWAIAGLFEKVVNCL